MARLMIGTNKPDHNIAVGHGALSRITTGSYNIALGDGALGDVTSESFQIQLGTIRLPENQPLAEALYAALADLFLAAG